MKKLFIPPALVFESIILIVLFYFLVPELNWIPFPVNFVGTIVAFIGFVIMGKARELFQKHKTTLQIEKSSYMITEGIFARTRNPMYIGMFLLLLGTGICFMNIFSMIIPFIFIALIQIIFIPKEEKLMSETFGEEYNAYKKHVRRWI